MFAAQMEVVMWGRRAELKETTLSQALPLRPSSSFRGFFSLGAVRFINHPPQPALVTIRVGCQEQGNNP